MLQLHRSRVACCSAASAGRLVGTFLLPPRCTGLAAAATRAPAPRAPARRRRRRW